MPAFVVLPKTGDAELVGLSRQTWERLRMICARAISAVAGKRCAWIDWHGDYLWRRLR